MVKLNDQTFSVNSRLAEFEAGRRTASITIHASSTRQEDRTQTRRFPDVCCGQQPGCPTSSTERRVQLDAFLVCRRGRQYGAEIASTLPTRRSRRWSWMPRPHCSRAGTSWTRWCHRRGEKMVHRSQACSRRRRPPLRDADLRQLRLHKERIFQSPVRITFEVYGYNFSSRSIIGGHVAVKPHLGIVTRVGDSRRTSPAPGWERRSFDMASPHQEQYIMRQAFESLTKRVYELTV